MERRRDTPLRACRKNTLEAELGKLARPKQLAARAGDWGDVHFEVLGPFGPGLAPRERQPFHYAFGLLRDVFPKDRNRVRLCVYRARCAHTGVRLAELQRTSQCGAEETDEDEQEDDEEDPRYESCLVACLWLGGEVVAAAALRLTLPNRLGKGQSAAVRNARAATTHLQVLFVGTAPHMRRRGLGRLLIQSVMKTAVEQGQHYVTALVANPSAATMNYWFNVGFKYRAKGLRGRVRGLPVVLREVLAESREQGPLTGEVWYGELPKQVLRVELKDEGPPQAQQAQQAQKGKQPEKAAGDAVANEADKEQEADAFQSYLRQLEYPVKRECTASLARPGVVPAGGDAGGSAAGGTPGQAAAGQPRGGAAPPPPRTGSTEPQSADTSAVPSYPGCPIRRAEAEKLVEGAAMLVSAAFEATGPPKQAPPPRAARPGARGPSSAWTSPIQLGGRSGGCAAEVAALPERLPQPASASAAAEAVRRRVAAGTVTPVAGSPATAPPGTCVVTCKQRLHSLSTDDVKALLGQEAAEQGVLPGYGDEPELPLRVAPSEQQQCATAAKLACRGVRENEHSARWVVVGLAPWLKQMRVGPGSTLRFTAVVEAGGAAAAAGPSIGGAGRGSRVVAVEVSVEAAVARGAAPAGRSELPRKREADAAPPPLPQPPAKQQHSTATGLPASAVVGDGTRKDEGDGRASASADAKAHPPQETAGRSEGTTDSANQLQPASARATDTCVVKYYPTASRLPTEAVEALLGPEAARSGVLFGWPSRSCRSGTQKVELPVRSPPSPEPVATLRCEDVSRVARWRVDWLGAWRAEAGVKTGSTLRYRAVRGPGSSTAVGAGRIVAVEVNLEAAAEVAGAQAQDVREPAGAQKRPREHDAAAGSGRGAAVKAARAAAGAGTAARAGLSPATAEEAVHVTSPAEKQPAKRAKPPQERGWRRVPGRGAANPKTGQTGMAAVDVAAAAAPAAACPDGGTPLEAARGQQQQQQQQLSDDDEQLQPNHNGSSTPEPHDAGEEEGDLDMQPPPARQAALEAAALKAAAAAGKGPATAIARASAPEAATPQTPAGAADGAPEAALSEALARHYPGVLQLLQAAKPLQVGQKLAAKKRSCSWEGRLRLTPREALLDFCRGWVIVYDTESMAVINARTGARYAGDAGSTAAPGWAHVTTAQLKSGDGVCVSATGKAATDKELAKELAAAACLQLLRVRPEDLAPQQPKQHPAATPAAASALQQNQAPAAKAASPGAGDPDGLSSGGGPAAAGAVQAPAAGGLALRLPAAPQHPPHDPRYTVPHYVPPPHMWPYPPPSYGPYFMPPPQPQQREGTPAAASSVQQLAAAAVASAPPAHPAGGGGAGTSAKSSGGAADGSGPPAALPPQPHSGYPGCYWLPGPGTLPGYGGPYAAGYPQPPPGAWGSHTAAGAQWAQGPFPPLPSPPPSAPQPQAGPPQRAAQ